MIEKMQQEIVTYVEKFVGEEVTFPRAAAQLLTSHQRQRELVGQLTEINMRRSRRNWIQRAAAKVFRLD